MNITPFIKPSNSVLFLITETNAFFLNFKYKFIDNIKIFSMLKTTSIADDVLTLYKDLESYLNVYTIDEIFELSYFNSTLTQKDIEIYNAVIGGKTEGNGKKIKGGLFAGYTKNLGAGTDGSGSTFYSRGSNIRFIYRVSPRIIFVSGNLSLVFETEYTAAAYGTANGNQKGGVTNTTTVANVRPIASISYKF